MKYKINLGCGSTPTPDYKNFDNSLSIKIASFPILFFFLKLLGILNKEQIQNVEWNKNNKITFCDVTKRIPLPDNSVQVIYSSHMIEHLSKRQLSKLLKEIDRVLCKNGILRVVLPDLKKIINNYNNNENAELFMSKLLMSAPNFDTLKEKIKLLFLGYRQHQWMYDEKSFTNLLVEHGFNKVIVLKAGDTLIPNYGQLNLYERKDESFYIEAIK